MIQTAARTRTTGSEPSSPALSLRRATAAPAMNDTNDGADEGLPVTGPRGLGVGFGGFGPSVVRRPAHPFHHPDSWEAIRWGSFSVAPVTEEMICS